MNNSAFQMIQKPSELSSEDFAYFQKKIFEYSGISLKETKQDLIKSRLISRLQQLSLNDYHEYRNYLESINPQDQEWQFFINVLTTNKTSFFREIKHFDFLKEQIGSYQNTNKKIRIWSAACSTGEEAYSLAMFISFHFPKIDFEIIGSDIDTKVLETAQNGVYHVDKYTDFPAELKKLTQIGQNQIADWFRIKSQIKNKVKFTHMNLLSDTFSFSEKFDIIFCRNVLIYFTHEDIQKLTNKFVEVSHNQTLLFISHSESLQNFKGPWKMVSPSVYKL